MSDIAGMLVIYVVDEEDAFWALAQLLNGPKHKMHGLFVRDFPCLQRYFKHHEKVLRAVLKPVFKHFKKLDVDCCTYAFKWYMQCFLGRVSVSFLGLNRNLIATDALFFKYCTRIWPFISSLIKFLCNQNIASLFSVVIKNLTGAGWPSRQGCIFSPTRPEPAFKFI